MAITLSVTPGDWLLLLAVPSVAAIALAIVFRPLSDERVDRWARARHLVLTDGSRELIRRYLNRTRRFRALGLAAGFVTVLLPAALTNFVHFGTAGRIFLIFAQSNGLLIGGCGYLLGAFLAEVSLARPGPQGPARAWLAPRGRSQYVGPGARAGLRGLAVALVVLLPWPLLYRHPSSTWTLSRPSIGHSALVALAGVVTALAVEALQETIVRRRQRYTDQAMIEADDAIRASSAAACTGVGLALLMSLVASQLSDIGLFATFSPLRWSVNLLGLVLGMGALAAWGAFGLGYARAVRRESRAPSSQPS